VKLRLHNAWTFCADLGTVDMGWDNWIPGLVDGYSPCLYNEEMSVGKVEDRWKLTEESKPKYQVLTWTAWRLERYFSRTRSIS
jgi:hypothetical protein